MQPCLVVLLSSFSPSLTLLKAFRTLANDMMKNERNELEIIISVSY